MARICGFFLAWTFSDEDGATTGYTPTWHATWSGASEDCAAEDGGVWGHGSDRTVPLRIGPLRTMAWSLATSMACLSLTSCNSFRAGLSAPESCCRFA